MDLVHHWEYNSNVRVHSYSCAFHVCSYIYLFQATVKLPLGDMLCSSDEAQLMRLLIELIKAKKVIEIGEMDI